MKFDGQSCVAELKKKISEGPTLLDIQTAKLMPTLNPSIPYYRDVRGVSGAPLFFIPHDGKRCQSLGLLYVDCCRISSSDVQYIS